MEKRTLRIKWVQDVNGQGGVEWIPNHGTDYQSSADAAA